MCTEPIPGSLPVETGDSQLPWDPFPKAYPSLDSEHQPVFESSLQDGATKRFWGHSKTHQQSMTIRDVLTITVSWMCSSGNNWDINIINGP